MYERTQRRSVSSVAVRLALGANGLSAAHCCASVDERGKLLPLPLPPPEPSLPKGGVPASAPPPPQEASSDALTSAQSTRPRAGRGARRGYGMKTPPLGAARSAALTRDSAVLQGCCVTSACYIRPREYAAPALLLRLLLV